MRADELVDRIGEKSAGSVRAVLHGDDATACPACAAGSWWLAPSG
jgi:hypothetical protein